MIGVGPTTTGAVLGAFAPTYGLLLAARMVLRSTIRADRVAL